jgi:hypothetical protein
MADDDLDIGASGDFSPYLKFNAKQNDWAWRSEDGEQKIDAPRFAWDLKNIQTCWLRFDEGAAPDRAIDPSPRNRAQRPSDRHKRGFVSRVFGRTSFTGAGEFSSNAVGVCSAVRELYRDFKAQALGHPGEVPIVAVVGTDSFKSRYGTNYSPRFKITAWIKRPPELPDGPVVPVANSDAKTTPVRSQVPAQSSPEGPGQSDDLDDEIPFAWIGALIVPWALTLLGAAGGA